MNLSELKPNDKKYKIVRLVETTGPATLYKIIDTEKYIEQDIIDSKPISEIKDDIVYLDGKKFPMEPGMQHNYFVQTNGAQMQPERLHDMGISTGEMQIFDGNSASDYLKMLGMSPAIDSTTWGPI